MAETALVLKQLQTLFIEAGFADPAHVLSPHTRLKDDLGLDSFDLVQLILLLNRHFHLELGSEMLTGEHLHSLETVAALVASLLK